MTRPTSFFLLSSVSKVQVRWCLLRYWARSLQFIEERPGKKGVDFRLFQTESVDVEVKVKSGGTTKRRVFHFSSLNRGFFHPFSLEYFGRSNSQGQCTSQTPDVIYLVGAPFKWVFSLKKLVSVFDWGSNYPLQR